MPSTLHSHLQELASLADPATLAQALQSVADLPHLPGEQKASPHLPTPTLHTDQNPSSDGQHTVLYPPLTSAPTQPTKQHRCTTWSAAHTALATQLSTAMACVITQGRAPHTQLARLLLKLPMGGATEVQQHSSSSANDTSSSIDSSISSSSSPCLPVLHAAVHLALHSSPGGMGAKPSLSLLRFMAEEEGGTESVLQVMPQSEQALQRPSSPSFVAETENGTQQSQQSLPRSSLLVEESEGTGSTHSSTHSSTHTHPHSTPSSPAALPLKLSPLLSALGSHLHADIPSLSTDAKQMQRVLLTYTRLGYVHTPLLHGLCEAVAGQLRASTVSGSSNGTSSRDSRDYSSSNQEQKQHRQQQQNMSANPLPPAYKLRDIATVLQACSTLGFSHQGLLQAAATSVQQQWDQRWCSKRPRSYAHQSQMVSVFLFYLAA